MISSFAFALLVQAPVGGRSTLLPFVFQVVAIFAIFYFVMIRPQQRQRKQHEERQTLLHPALPEMAGTGHRPRRRANHECWSGGDRPRRGGHPL